MSAPSFREAAARIISPSAFAVRGKRIQPRQDRAHNRARALAKADEIARLVGEEIESLENLLIGSEALRKHATPDHEALAEAIYNAVRALPLTLGMLGVHQLTWTDVRALSPGEAERYRKAADACFWAWGTYLPPNRALAIHAAQAPRKRPKKAKARPDER